MRYTHLAPAALIALVLAVPFGSAMYIETPFTIAFDQPQAQVGDERVLDIRAANDSTKAAYAGRTLRLVYTFVPAEGDSAVSREVGEIALDDKATGTLRWTVPAEVDDANVDFALMDGEEPVGYGHLPVGDAPPTLMVAQRRAAESSPAEDAPQPATTADGAATDTSHSPPVENEEKPVPFVGVALVALGLVAAVLAFRRA